MRSLALAALAAIFSLSAFGAHPDDTWKNLKMYRKVTKTDPSHPIHQCFGPHGDIYAVELTDEFRDYLRNGPEFNEHRRGNGNGGGNGQGQPAPPASTLMSAPPPVDDSWVMPVWAPRSSLVTLRSESGYTWADFPAPGTMRWMFAKCENATTRQWAAQGTYVDEFVTLVRPDGTCVNYTIHDILIDQDTGCPGIGGWNQEMPADPALKGDWEFNLMYLHAVEGDNPSGTTDPKWRPIYDYRDGKYRCVVHVP